MMKRKGRTWITAFLTAAMLTGTLGNVQSVTADTVADAAAAGATMDAEATGTAEQKVQTADQEAVVEELTAMTQQDADDPSKTPVLTLNQVKTDALTTATDENWYKFTITGNGYFRVALDPNNGTNQDGIKRGWDVYVYEKGDLINAIQTYTNVESAGMLTGYLPFGKGDYYIKICSNWLGYEPIDCKYDLKVSYQDDATWEKEDNDTNSAANTISVNKTYNGTLYCGEDEDWYKFTRTEDGYFNLKFLIDNRTDIDGIKNGWNVAIYNSKFEQIQSYNIKTSTETPVIPYGKGTFYIKVYRNWQGYEPIDCIYNLTVVSKNSSMWEKEGNGESSLASNLALNKTYSGTLYYGEDVDWYSFKTTAKGVIKVTLAKSSSANIEDIKNGWDISIYDKTTGNELSHVNNIKSSDSMSLTLNKGTYLIKVKANWLGYEPLNCIYNLKSTYAKTPGKTSITKLAKTKNSATVTWKKVSGATGYYVYRSTSKNGTYSKVATIKKGATVSYKNTKLKANKTYYYKVAAYTTVSGVTAKGSFSDVKAVRTLK